MLFCFCTSNKTLKFCYPYCVNSVSFTSIVCLFISVGFSVKVSYRFSRFFSSSFSLFFSLSLSFSTTCKCNGIPSIQGVEPIWLEKGLFWLKTNKMVEKNVKFPHRQVHFQLLSVFL